MATSKTLAPTNVTISIPAMADAPDASVFSNCVDKEADAINALNSQIAGYGSSKIYTVGANQSITIPMTGFGVWLIFRSYAPNIVFVKANGDVESAVGNATHISVSVSNNILTVTNLLTWANMIIAMGA